MHFAHWHHTNVAIAAAAAVADDDDDDDDVTVNLLFVCIWVCRTCASVSHFARNKTAFLFTFYGCAWNLTHFGLEKKNSNNNNTHSAALPAIEYISVCMFANEFRCFLFSCLFLLHSGTCCYAIYILFRPFVCTNIQTHTHTHMRKLNGLCRFNLVYVCACMRSLCLNHIEQQQTIRLRTINGL